MPEAPDPAELLAKHVPRLRFSSLESYRADAVETMTERFTGAAGPVWLKRKDDRPIASTHPRGDEARLTVGFLAGSRYGNGQRVLDGDYLDIGGRDYVEAARIRHANPTFANRVYGRVVADDRGTWLQYWFYYFYNSKSFVIGKHEGDWEMVQFRLTASGRHPAVATYSQHSFAERRPWSRVQRDGPTPIVYVGLGSHANYFQPGQYRFQRIFTDHALGDGESVVPTLVDITDPGPKWTRWTGRWGSTEPKLADIGASPPSPCRQSKWAKPSAYHAEAIERPPVTRALGPPAPAPPQPVIDVRREDDHAIVEYAIPVPVEGQPDVALLAVSLDAVGSAAAPATYTFPLDSLKGTIEHPTELGDGPHVVRAVTVDPTGMMSAEASEPVPERARARRRPSPRRRGGTARPRRRSARGGR